MPPTADGDRLVEGRAIHPMVARGFVGAAPRRQGHVLGVTPWPALPTLLAPGHLGGCGVGVEKTILWMGWLTCGARVAAAARESGEARGRGRRALAACWAAARVGPACLLRALAGLLAGLLRAGGPRSFFFFSFSFFYF